jgi:hypothetical protein
MEGDRAMKKHWLIAVAALLCALGNSPLVDGSEVIVEVPGKSIVQDIAGDLQLRHCDFDYPNISCSIPPNEPLSLPGYFDIKKVSITQIGNGLVDLSIQLYEPIPVEPPYPFANYYWQFDGGCLTGEPGDKDAISIIWRNRGDGIWEWGARWYVVTDCEPRTVTEGDPVAFKFTDDGVKVRVSLAELVTAMDGEGVLIWHAGVRRMPFVQPPFTHTVGVDFAPDVIAFSTAPPPLIIRPDDPAIWEPRFATDLISPVVTITSPTSNPTYTTSSSTLVLGGVASDNVAVNQVTWANGRGGSGVCSGTSTWSCSGILLSNGQNVLTVTARDSANNSGADVLTVMVVSP